MAQLQYAQRQGDFDGEIHQFFAGQSATRAECDDLARTTFGGLVEPVAAQGATSYTVVVGQNRDKIVQFRCMDAQLDLTMLALARHIHGNVVPAGTALGHIGSDAQKQLAIYEMDRLPGDNFILVRESLAEEPQHHLAAVHGLARFFAQAWNRPVALSQQAVSAMATELSSRLEAVSSSGVLTDRLRPAFEEVMEHLPSLLSGDFPLAITHSDLNEMNILVDGCSGNITGVIDWVDVGIQPFGLTLYILDSFVGAMGRKGWTYCDNADLLREEFWKTFIQHAGPAHSQMKSIEAARKAGYFLRYGTVSSDSDGHKGVGGLQYASIESRRLYLEAVV